jgi:hypothetical protein
MVFQIIAPTLSLGDFATIQSESFNSMTDTVYLGASPRNEILPLGFILNFLLCYTTDDCSVSQKKVMTFHHTSGAEHTHT